VKLYIHIRIIWNSKFLRFVSNLKEQAILKCNPVSLYFTHYNFITGLLQHILQLVFIKFF